MLKNHLLITLRSMMKNKVYLFINIFGMAMAIATCIVGYYNYDFNDSFDKNHVNGPTIYRVNSIREFQNQETTFGYVPYGLHDMVRENVADVTLSTHYLPDDSNFRIGDEVFDETLAYVDQSFFDLFSYDFIEGTPLQPHDKGSLVISEKLAKTYFGNVSALGKEITQVLNDGQVKQFVVAGVFKEQPVNSSFYNDVFTLTDNYPDRYPDVIKEPWRNHRTTLFIQVKDPSRLEAVNKQLQPYVQNNNAVREDFIIRRFEVVPFLTIGKSDSYNDVQGTWTRDGSPLAAVVGTGMMGILILLIACFNLTNTSIAISSRRLKEIGIRKVMGSERKQLIAQFLGETMILCFVALILGIVLAELFLIPAFNQLWPEMKLSPNYFGKPDFIIFITSTLLLTALLAGSYPAFYISGFKSITILKGKLKFGGTNNFTRILLTLQFAISLIGIVASIAFIQNARYQRDFDLGFNKSGVIRVWVSNRTEYEAYRNKLIADRDILSIAGTEHHFLTSYYNDPVKSAEQEIEVDILNVGDDYLKTAGLTLVKGRDFVTDSETDRKESVIVTEDVARKFGWDEPIGKEIVWMDSVHLYVVGVIKDVYSAALWRPFRPAMLRYGAREPVNIVLVNADVANIKSVNTFMEKAWHELFPNKIYNGAYMDDEIVEANTVNVNIVKMFVFLGVVALLLSATGLFSLVSLNIIKKMKEIGVRKVLGASISNISRVINLEFAIIIVISCVLGAIAGGWLSGLLMSGIWTYYLHASVWTMVASAVFMLVVCFLTVAFKTYNTAKMNPVNVLRDE